MWLPRIRPSGREIQMEGERGQGVNSSSNYKSELSGTLIYRILIHTHVYTSHLNPHCLYYFLLQVKLQVAELIFKCALYHAKGF